MFKLFKSKRSTTAETTKVETVKTETAKADAPDIFIAIPSLVGIITDDYRQAVDEYNDRKDRLGFADMEVPKVLEKRKNKFVNVTKFNVLSYLVDWSEQEKQPLLIVNLYCPSTDERIVENFLVSVSEWHETFLPLFNGEYIDIDTN